MSELTNWRRLFPYLLGCFVVTFTAKIWIANITLPAYALTWDSFKALLHAFSPIFGAATVALTVTGVVFGGFAKWGWRWSISRKVGLVNFPDLTGTWHATSYPAEWPPFT